MESNQNSTVSRRVYIATVLFLLLLNGGTAYVLYNSDTEKKAVTAQKASLERDFQKHI
jgi:hypothetical protein